MLGINRRELFSPDFDSTATSNSFSPDSLLDSRLEEEEEEEEERERKPAGTVSHKWREREEVIICIFLNRFTHMSDQNLMISLPILTYLRGAQYRLHKTSGVPRPLTA